MLGSKGAGRVRVADGCCCLVVREGGCVAGCVAEGGWNDCYRPGNVKWFVWNEGGADNVGRR